MKPFSIMLLVGALLIGVAVLTSHWVADGYDDYSVHAGLYSSTFCSHGDCESAVMIKFLGKGGVRDMVGIAAGTLALLGGLASAVLAMISAFSTKAGRRGPVQIAVILTGVTAFLALVYLVLMHAISPGGWGFSAFMFWVGTAAVITGAMMAMQAIPAAGRMMMMPGYAGYPQGYQQGYQQGYGQPGMMQPGMPGMPGMPPQGPQMGQMPPMGMQGGYPMQPQQPQMQPQQPQQPGPPPCNQCGGQTQWVAQYGKLFCGRCNRYIV